MLCHVIDCSGRTLLSDGQPHDSGCAEEGQCGIGFAAESSRSNRLVYCLLVTASIRIPKAVHSHEYMKLVRMLDVEAVAVWRCAVGLSGVLMPSASTPPKPAFARAPIHDA
jgi:hypothetical protein